MKGDSSQPSRGRVATAALASAVVLTPLAVFGGPALAGGASPSAAEYQYKLTVCHFTHSKKHPWVKIKVSAAAWRKAHSKRDFIVTATKPCPPAGATQHKKPKHGKP
jgi:hypothetical protein